MRNDTETGIAKLGAAILFLSVLLLISGCSRQGEYGLNKNWAVTVTIWHSYEGRQLEIFDREVGLFNETVGAEKGIIVEAFEKGSVEEIRKKVLASAQGEVGSEDIPDIFSACGETLCELNKMGIVLDFGKYMTKEELDEYVDVFMREGKLSDGENYYLFPIAKATEILALNKTDWDKFADAAGVSENDLNTWEGIVRVSELYYKWTDSLTEELDDGKALFGRDTFINYMLIGGKLLEENTAYIEDEQELYEISKKTMRYLWDHYYIPSIKGYYRVEERFCSSDIKTGDIIGCVCYTSNISCFPDFVTLPEGYSYPIEAAVYRMPEFEGSQIHSVGQGAGMAVIKSNETTEYAAIIFLKWFTEKERNIEFAIHTGYVPVRKEAFEEDNKLKTIENHQDELSQILKDTFLYASDSIFEYPVCNSNSFKTQYQFAELANKLMSDRARADREEICRMMESGITYENSIAVYDNDENFLEWFTDFYEKLKEIRAEK